MRIGQFSFNKIDNYQYAIFDDALNQFGHLLKGITGTEVEGIWAWYIDKSNFLLKVEDIQIIQDKLKELNKVSLND